MILSFGLTALMQNQIIAASTLKTSQERYNALLIARQFLDQALVSNEWINLEDNKICQNKVCFLVSRRKQALANDQNQITVDVRWRHFHVSLSASAYHY